MTAPTVASIGFSINTGTVNDDVNNYRYTVIEIDGTATYCAIQMLNMTFVLETSEEDGLGSVAFATGTTYEGTIQYTQNGTCLAKIYNSSTGALLGTLTGTVGDVAPIGFSFGKSGTETGVAGVYYNFDNITVDYATGAYPILP
jgi:hypothetical protein